MNDLLRPNAPLWLYWEGPRPAYVDLCLELLQAYNPEARVVGPVDVLRLGFPPDIWEAVQRWHVPQRADAIRFFLLWQYGGIWCDADCIPMQSFWPLGVIASQTPSGLAAYDSTDNTIGCGLMAARPHSEAVATMWEHIAAIARSGQIPEWLEVSSRPLAEIVRQIGRENVALWPNAHVSPVLWTEIDRLLQEGTDAEHAEFTVGFPAAWCWMLYNTIFSDRGVNRWTRHECLRGRSLLSYLFRESFRRLQPPPPPRGRAVAVLNVHNDWYPPNLRQSAQAAAQRWGAEFVEIRTPIVPWFDAWWEKLNLDRHLWMYERVVFLDRDVAVRSDCPSLFDLVPENAFGIVPSEQEGHHLIDAHIRRDMAPLCRLLDVDMDYSTQYYNSGVMVFSPQRHSHVFALARAIHPLVWTRSWVTIDQGLLSLALLILAEPVHRLPCTFNRCGAKLWDHWQPKMDDYIWHFCGPKTWEKMAATIWQIDDPG